MEPTAGRPVSMPRSAAASIPKPNAITWVTLAFMTTASVASLRSAPTMAVYGLVCVFLYIVPAIVFLMQALVAAELASGWSGGVFRWVSEGISPRWGLLAVWCQFAMTIFYYPTLLGFVASTLAYVFNPDLAEGSDDGASPDAEILRWSRPQQSSRQRLHPPLHPRLHRLRPDRPRSPAPAAAIAGPTGSSVPWSSFCW